MGFENCANRWTKEEENFVLSNIKHYKGVIENLPLPTMAQKIDRSEGAIKLKAMRLLNKLQEEYEWSKEERALAFSLYTQDVPTEEILEKLHETGSQCNTKHLKTELSRLRKAWEQRIRTYAEERQLPIAKKIKLSTIRFYIGNVLTDKDFVRKVLHERIKNG